MRKTIMSLSLAAALASTNVMADVDTLNAVKADLPQGVSLTEADAARLEAANTEQLIADAIAEIVASLGNNESAITAVIQAAISENPSMADTIVTTAANRVPTQVGAISAAVTTLGQKKLSVTTRNFSNEGSGIPGGENSGSGSGSASPN